MLCAKFQTDWAVWKSNLARFEFNIECFGGISCVIARGCHNKYELWFTPKWIRLFTYLNSLLYFTPKWIRLFTYLNSLLYFTPKWIRLFTYLNSLLYFTPKWIRLFTYLNSLLYFTPKWIRLFTYLNSLLYFIYLLKLRRHWLLH